MGKLVDRCRAKAGRVLEADGVQVLITTPDVWLDECVSLDFDPSKPLGDILVSGISSLVARGYK